MHDCVCIFGNGRKSLGFWAHLVFSAQSSVCVDVVAWIQTPKSVRQNASLIRFWQQFFSFFLASRNFRQSFFRFFSQKDIFSSLSMLDKGVKQKMVQDMSKPKLTQFNAFEGAFTRPQSQFLRKAWRMLASSMARCVAANTWTSVWMRNVWMCACVRVCECMHAMRMLSLV